MLGKPGELLEHDIPQHVAFIPCLCKAEIQRHVCDRGGEFRHNIEYGGESALYSTLFACDLYLAVFEGDYGLEAEQSAGNLRRAR